LISSTKVTEAVGFGFGVLVSPRASVLRRTPKGKMKPQMHRYAPRAATFSRPSLSPSCRAAAAASIAKKAERQLGCLLVLSVIVLLFLMETGKLFAQQTQSGDQGWSQNDQLNGQYEPNEQSELQSDYEQQPDAQRRYPDSGQTYPQGEYGQAPAQPLDAVQLEQLVAPIALYPDRLVAQVLAASTYPSQVADADDWRQTQRYASPDQIAAGADVQSWDPSVKALTAFPQVLAQMDRNLQWTTDLGNAYYNQPQDVLEAVQVMRRRAQQAGNLQSTPQQAVHYDEGYVQLMPVNPQLVYVPTYNPWTVYGEQVSPYPGFSLLGAVGSFLGSSPIDYGLGIAMSAFSQPWGWLAWGLNWLAQSVLFNQSDYYSHSSTVADWGFRHDGLHAYAGRSSFARYSNGHTSDGFRRFGGGHNANRGQGFGRTPGRYAENWRGNSNAGFHAFGTGYDRAPRQAYNHMQAAENWRQFNRHSNGSSLNRSTGEDHRGWAGAGYDHSMQSHRGPTSGFQTSEFRGRSSGAFANRNFAPTAGKPPHSGSFHLFGGGHAPKSVSSRGLGGFHMGGGGHAPKSFHGGGKNFGGGRSHGGGGHSSAHGGKHRR
jgi:uncharacterized protein DUF3300